jgi:hypothetical protein
VFRKLDAFARERLARNLARSQPQGEKRRKRKWTYYAQHDATQLAALTAFTASNVAQYTGRAKAGWRAV